MSSRFSPRLLALVAGAAVLLSLRPADAAEIVRGPYLQCATDTSVVIRWRTDVATTSEIVFGASPASLLRSVTDATSVTEHEIRVGGLTPDTRHYYRAGAIGEPLAPPDADDFFSTAPVPGTSRPARIWILGDSGTANAGAAAVRDAFLAYAGGRSPDVWLLLGDNAYDAGTDREYQEALFDMYPTLLRNTPVWPTRGNHDDAHAGDWNDYLELFTLPARGEAGGVPSGTEAYYSFDYGEVHFICLDSEGSSNDPGSPMLTWLERDLAATGARWILAYWHRPPYSKGSHDSDAESVLTAFRENVVPILEAHGVDLVLTGHSHSYERSFLLDGHYGASSTLHDSMKVDTGDGREDGDGPYRKSGGPHGGAVYVVAGNGGSVEAAPLNHPAMVVSLAELGSVVVDVDGKRLDATFLDAAGAVRDRFTMLDESGASSVLPRVHLAPPAPNPGRAAVRFEIEVAAPGEARLAIFDAAGRLVAEVLDGHLAPGRRTLVWEGVALDGGVVPAGQYFAVLEALGERRVQKVAWLQ